MKISNSIEFGQLIKARRKELGYTQNDIASFLGFSTSFISHLENGKSTIELEKSIKVATALGLNLSLEER